MRKEQNETLLAITTRYLADVQAGHSPRLSDYLARYPRYAAEIADFVAYYHACEEPLLFPPWASAETAFPQGMPNLVYSRPTRPDMPQTITSLLTTVSGQQLTITCLAMRLELSEEIAALLEQRAIAPASIPQTLYLKLAALLQLPVGVVQAYFFSWEKTVVSGDLSSRQKVAETSGYYSPSRVDNRLDFRVLLDGDAALSPQQKERWWSILAAEQETV
jgi:hypothetical protein